MRQNYESYQTELKKTLASKIAWNIIENELNGITIYHIEDNKQALAIRKDLKTIEDILIKKLSYKEISTIFKTTYKNTSIK